MPSVILAGAALKFNQNEIQLTTTHNVDGLNFSFSNVFKSDHDSAALLYIQVNLEKVVLYHSAKLKVPSATAIIPSHISCCAIFVDL